MPRRRLLSARGLAAALALASCGGEDPAGTEPTSSSAPDAPSGSGATASAGPGVGAGSGSGGSAASSGGAGGAGGGAPIQCAPGGPEGPAAPSTAKVPTAFVARGHVEALGSLPSQARWEADLEAFRAKGCSAATLGAFARSLFESAEFLALPYSNAQRLLGSSPAPASRTCGSTAKGSPIRTPRRPTARTSSRSPPPRSPRR